MQNELIEIYKKGFANYKTVNTNYQQLLKKRSLKVFAYYAGVILLNKKRALNMKTVYIVDGSTFRKNVSCELFNKGDDVYRGDFFNSLKELRTFPTFVSELSMRERFSTLFTCINTCVRDKSITDMASFLDFSFIYEFLRKLSPQRICSRGHYDMMATWFGELSEYLGIDYYIYQHGIVSRDIIIPFKYFCTCFNGFDEYSINVFRNNYIKNEDCKYSVFPFKSSVAFQDINKEPGFIYIGIIEQINKEWVDTLISKIKGPNIKIIVMRHPLSQYEYSDEAGNDISTSTKYFDFDAIITDYSTMVLDYIRAGYKGVIYYTSKAFVPTFSDYTSLRYADMDEIGMRLREGTEGRLNGK